MARLKNGNLWLEYSNQQLSDTKTLSNTDNQFQFLDPNGANRDVLLPNAITAGGLEFTIVNTTSGIYDLIVKDNTGNTTITNIEPDEISKFACNGTIWKTMGGMPEGFLTSSIVNGDTIHAPSGDVVYDALSTLSGIMVPIARTINGIPLSSDIELHTSGGLSSYLFCEDVTFSGTSPPWHELESQSDGGVAGFHTATTTSYTELDRYATHALNTDIIPEGNWVFNLYAKISASNKLGKIKASIYKVNNVGAIVGGTIGTGESYDISNITPGIVTFGIFVSEQTGWQPTDRIGIVLEGKLLSPAATLTFYHDYSLGYISTVDTSLSLLHNQLNGLNSGDYKHLTSSEKSKLDGIATGATAYTDSMARSAVIASSISDADTTHSPDGNSVFDALALKAPLASPTFTGTPAAPVVADNVATTQLATTAFAKSQDAVFTRSPNQAVELTAAASGSNGISIANSVHINFGTGNFSISWTGALPDYTPATEQLLIQKFLSNVGIKLAIRPSAIRVYLNTTSITSTNACPFIDGTTHNIIVVVSVAATTTVTIYLDGVLFYQASSITNVGTVTNTDILYILGTSAVRYAGRVSSVHLFNRALTATEVLDLYRNVVANADKWGSQTELIAATNDRTFAGANNWVNNGGFNSFINTTYLAVSATAAGQYCSLPIANAPMTPGKRYRLSFDASSIIGSCLLLDFTRSIDYLAPNSNPIDLISGRNTFEFTLTTSTGGIAIYAQTSSFACTFDNFSLIEIGSVLALEPEGIQHNRWYDSSSNTLEAFYPTSGWKVTRTYNRPQTFKNLFINGNMAIDIRNRGASQTLTASTYAYTVDRMRAFCAGVNTTGQRIAGPNPGQYLYQINGVGGEPGLTIAALGQCIPSYNIAPYVGKIMTFSALISSSTLTSIEWCVYYPSALDDHSSVTTSFEGVWTISSTLTRYSTSFIVPANCSNGMAMYLVTGLFTSGNLKIGELQLEEGAAFTGFEIVDEAVEVARCEHYARYIPLNGQFVSAGAGHTLETCMCFPAMRTIPTIGTNVTDPDLSQTLTNISTAGLIRASRMGVDAYFTSTASGWCTCLGYRGFLSSEIN